MNPRMKKINIHRVLAALLAALLVLTLVPAAFAAETEGKCGDNVQWTLTGGKLTISGTGPMDNYSKNSPAPWHELRQQIRTVVIASGVTTVGSQAFYDCQNLTAVSMPDSVTKINRFAFLDCVKLTQVTLSGALSAIGDSAFEGCASLSAIRLPRYLNKIGERAFYRCESLGGITIPASVTELGPMVFGYCYRLSVATIEAPVKSLPYWFFYGCINLMTVSLPNTVENIEENALTECPRLTFVQGDLSSKVQQQISDAMDAPTSLGEPGERFVEFTETENSAITSDTYFPELDSEEQSQKVVDAVVENAEGWQEVVDFVENNLSAVDTTVNVQIKTQEKLDTSALEDLVGKNVTVNIHTDQDGNWQMNMEHQTPENLDGEQALSVQLTPYTPTDKQKQTVGDAPCNMVTMGQTNWNTTVKIPVGQDAVRGVASLYRVEKNNSLTLIQSVIVDDDGNAAFSLAGTSAGDYVVALNVKDIPEESVRVPQSLYGEYGVNPEHTLMGMDGKYYAITGQTSSLGISMGQLTWIIVAVLVVSLVAVGCVMFFLNKRKLQRGYVPDWDDED